LKSAEDDHTVHISGARHLILHFCTNMCATKWRLVTVRGLQMQRGFLQRIGTLNPLANYTLQSATAEGSGISKLIKRNFSTSNPTNAELQSQIAELSSTCTRLSQQVEILTDLVKRQGSNNLLERQAANGGGIPARDHFRPTIDMVANQVNHASQLDNDNLALLAISGDTFARRERLLREIMQVDKCSWDDAHEKLIEMDEFNEQKYWACTMPYRLGITGAILGCVGSVLLVYSKSFALLYAENIAEEELPDGVQDVSDMTYNQVGAWTWSWMEPMIGTASFVLLCLQFGRAQSVKMRMFPYTEAMLTWRARRLTTRYPEYDGSMVRSWAKVLPSVGWNFMPKFRRHLYTPKARYQNFRGGI